MARGSGLSFDPLSSSDRIFLGFDHSHHTNLKTEQGNMEDESNGFDDHGDTVRESSDHHKRIVIDEMDFFGRNDNQTDGLHHQTSTAVMLVDDKEPVTNVNTRLHLLTANTGSDQSTIDDGISPNSDDKISPKSTEVEALRAKVERINEENQQLRDTLNQVTNNYNALQMHLVTLMQQQQQQKHHDDSKGEHDNKDQSSSDPIAKHSIVQIGERGPKVPRQFMDLGLNSSVDEPNLLSNLSDGQTLALRSRSPVDDNHDSNRGNLDNGQGWVANKAPRFNESPTKANGSGHIDQATEATMRKARVSVRARSEAPMITDGCQWRKYGQKMAKGNPCPRAYYRCTMASGCPVRKQVQRCAEDRSILITTYEGTHSHPLPPAAMMMASGTSSAARMLLSGSMPSVDGSGLINHPPNFLAYSRSLFPGSPSSVATISASAPFPTVTLDLTQSPNNNPLQQLFQKPNQNFPIPLTSQLFNQPLYNQSRFSGLQVSEQHGGSQSNCNNPLAETVNALTTDPNFTAALAAAITSLMGNGSANNSNNIHNPFATATSDSNGNNATSHDNNSNGN